MWFAALGVLLVAGVWFPRLSLAGLVANGVLALVAITDLYRMVRPEQIEILRETSDVLSVGAANPVVLRVLSRAPRPITIEITDEPPVPSRSEGLPFEATLTPQREVEATYHLYPQKRGPNQFRNVYFRYRSPLGLWSQNVQRQLVDDVRIYPDIRTVRRFDLLAKRNRLSEMGLKLWRLRGKEGEFERLREYRREDEMRHIDWSATAKHQKLISREYTTERNQNIVILLDCGRSMLNETDGISHLDRGLNAAIILSYIALGQGDNVSLVAFSNRLERYVGPVRGKTAIRSLIQKTYDLEARHEASDYGLACEDLLRRQKKRALVLLITYALDDQHLDAIGRYLRSLISSHLFLCVLLKDLPLVGLAERVPETDVEAYQVAAAAEMLAAQERRLSVLRARGIHATEVVPNELAAEVINHYLDVKARHLL